MTTIAKESTNTPREVSDGSFISSPSDPYDDCPFRRFERRLNEI